MKICLNFILLFITATALCQTNPSALPPINWQLMDWKSDGYPGISLEKAYSELLLHKKPLKKIIVAIIDDGFDSTHPDLAGMLWTNTKEIQGNGIDDDKNGYIDDIHGWNFIGTTKEETYEEVREFVRLKNKFETNKDTITLKADPDYAYWKKVVVAKDKKINQLKQVHQMQMMFLMSEQTLQTYWNKKLAKDSVYIIDIKTNEPDSSAGSAVLKAQTFVLSLFKRAGNKADSVTLTSMIDEVNMHIKEYNERLEPAETVIEKNDAAYFRKEAMNDNPYTNTNKAYGNNKILPDQSHGTECAGFIAALRNNNLGGNGITNSVQIMPVRIFVTTDDDEVDKDVANAIRYAVNNGAQVINMSFGKYFSPEKDWVQDAIKYAEKKGVLLVNAAGNDATDDDSLTFYPNAPTASNFIKVGASTYDSSLVARFSNYGARSVDLFAPGVSMYATELNGGYSRHQGTSYSAPMVAGLAALIWSYYPQFTYQQVRECIEQSATQINVMVTKPGTNNKVPFRSLCRTGGIVNAYKAIEIAEKIAGKK